MGKYTPSLLLLVFYERNDDNYTNSAQRLLNSAFGCWLF